MHFVMAQFDPIADFKRKKEIKASQKVEIFDLITKPYLDSLQVDVTQSSEDSQYQVLINYYKEKCSQIQIFRDRDSKIELLGCKWIISSQKNQFKEVKLMPLLDDCNTILGTQLSIDGKIIELPNDSDEPWLFNELTCQGRYNLIKNGEVGFFVIVEAQYKDQFLESGVKEDKYEILERVRNTILNLVPENMVFQQITNKNLDHQ